MPVPGAMTSCRRLLRSGSIKMKCFVLRSATRLPGASSRPCVSRHCPAQGAACRFHFSDLDLLTSPPSIDGRSRRDGPELPPWSRRQEWTGRTSFWSAVRRRQPERRQRCPGVRAGEQPGQARSVGWSSLLDVAGRCLRYRRSTVIETEGSRSSPPWPHLG